MKEARSTKTENYAIIFLVALHTWASEILVYLFDSMGYWSGGATPLIKGSRLGRDPVLQVQTDSVPTLVQR